MVHVSEISHQELGSVEDIESVINVGQSLDLTIVNVDAERKRLGLSLISSAKPEENEEVQVASVAEDSQTNSEENSDATSVSTDEDSTNEEATEEEKEV